MQSISFRNVDKDNLCEKCFYYERHFSKFLGRYVLVEGCGHCSCKQNKTRNLFGKGGKCEYFDEAENKFDAKAHFDEETKRLSKTRVNDD